MKKEMIGKVLIGGCIAASPILVCKALSPVYGSVNRAIKRTRKDIETMVQMLDAIEESSSRICRTLNDMNVDSGELEHVSEDEQEERSPYTIYSERYKNALTAEEEIPVSDCEDDSPIGYFTKK